MSPSIEHVTILLSIHDGEQWLDALLDSVRGQSHTNWTMLVRDDGTSDGSAEVVARHGAADGRVRLLDDDGLGNLGPAASYMSLLGRVTDGAFAFCDQDDVWLPHKLAWSLDALAGAPPMSVVVTDAEVTDADGRVLQASALEARGVRGPLMIGRLLINNAAIGATMLGDAALARAAVDAAEGYPVHMHDWWCALVAAYAGEVAVVAGPTIVWRRHAGTVTGATPPTLRGRARRRLDYLAWSIHAARLLRDAPFAPVPTAVAPVAALAAAEPENPRLRELVAAWRTGVRAWTVRAQLGLVVAVLGRKWCF